MTQEEKLMIKFLELSFPVRRIKHNMRFKRTIINEYGEAFQLSNQKQSNLLYFKLLDTLKIVFDTPDSLNKHVLKTFLHLK